MGKPNTTKEEDDAKPASGWGQIRWWLQKILPTLIPSLIALAIGAYLNLQVENQKRESEARIAKIQAETDKDIADKQLHADARRRALEHYNQIVASIEEINEQQIPDPGKVKKVSNMIRDLRLHETNTLIFIQRLAELTDHRLSQHDGSGQQQTDGYRWNEEPASSDKNKSEEPEGLHAIRQTIDEELYNSISTIKFKITNASFSGRSLRGIDLRNSNITFSRFSKSNLYSANFGESDLFHSDFSGADLQNANFSNARLTGARFDNARLQNANFTGARIRDVSFLKAYGVTKAVIPASLIAGPIFKYEDLAYLIKKHKEILLEKENEKLICFLWGRYHEGVEMVDVELLTDLAKENEKIIETYLASNQYIEGDPYPQTTIYKNLIRAHFEKEGWQFEVVQGRKNGRDMMIGRCTRSNWSWSLW